jgi:hypothetical protein
MLVITFQRRRRPRVRRSWIDRAEQSLCLAIKLPRLQRLHRQQKPPNARITGFEPRAAMPMPPAVSNPRHRPVSQTNVLRWLPFSQLVASRGRRRSGTFRRMVRRIHLPGRLGRIVPIVQKYIGCVMPVGPCPHYSPRRWYYRVQWVT